MASALQRLPEMQMPATGSAGWSWSLRKPLRPWGWGRCSGWGQGWRGPDGVLSPGSSPCAGSGDGGAPYESTGARMAPAPSCRLRPGPLLGSSYATWNPPSWGRQRPLLSPAVSHTSSCHQHFHSYGVPAVEGFTAQAGNRGASARQE